MIRKIIIIAVVIWYCYLSIQMAPASEKIPMPKWTPTGQSIYVPVYSHIYSGDRGTPFLLAVTLSIRNLDPDHPITLLSADYYDTNGKHLTNYIQTPVLIAPFSTTRFFVKESDAAGGSGAKFLVRWKSERPVHPPLVEAIMIGAQNQQGISFTSRGIVIDETRQENQSH